MELITTPLDPAPQSTPGNILKYPREKTLFILLAVASITILVGATLLSVGIIWLVLLWSFLIYLTLASYFICYLRGNAVKVGEDQFPELYVRFKECCDITGVKRLPSFYLLSGDGALNAFAARFLNHYYVVLLSSVVDALDEDEAAIKMIIGHELGHIRQGHLASMWWIRFAEWIPLIGPAYSRAQEYTCDQYGLACCPDIKTAVHAMSVLAAGSRRWKTLNKVAYIEQCRETGGFWMSINELTSDYPWLCKRVARLYHGDQVKFPRRHALAWLLAAFVPGTGLGLFGAAILYSYLFVIILTMAMAAGGMTMLGKLRELASPDLAHKNLATLAYYEATTAAQKVDTFFTENEHMPEDLAEAGVEVSADSPIRKMALSNEAGAVLTVSMKAPADAITLVLTRGEADTDEAAQWTCTGGPATRAALLPDECTAAATANE